MKVFIWYFIVSATWYLLRYVDNRVQHFFAKTAFLKDVLYDTPEFLFCFLVVRVLLKLNGDFYYFANILILYCSYNICVYQIFNYLRRRTIFGYVGISYNVSSESWSISVKFVSEEYWAKRSISCFHLANPIQCYNRPYLILLHVTFILRGRDKSNK